MKHFGIKFIISFLLGIGAIALILTHYYLYAAIICIPAFFLNAKEIKEYASFYQYNNFRLHTLALGFSVDMLIGENTWYYTVCMFVLQFAGPVRLELLNVLYVNRKMWIEVAALFIAHGIYLFAGLRHPAAWEGWALPVLPILFMTYIGASIVKRTKGKKGKTEEQIRTELGKKAPGFSLHDVEGKKISLSDFENKNHVLLIFVRGDWCPTCHIMIRAYENNRDRFLEKDIVPIGISPDSTEVNRSMMERLGWKNMLLADTNQEVASQYGILFTENNPETNYQHGVALPASFLVDKNGVLRHMSRSDRAGEFLSPSLIFPIIDKLS